MKDHLSDDDSPVDDEIVDRLLAEPEGLRVEFKRVSRRLQRALETVVAFANTEGGILVFGIEDESKANGRDRVYGIGDRPEAIDEFERLVTTRVVPTLPKPSIKHIGCTLRDGSRGSICVFQVAKSEAVHSIVNDGTWQRFSKSNRQLVAEEITRLSLERGSQSAEQRLADVDFALLETDHWANYARQRRLTRSLPQALRHLGLAQKDTDGSLKPTWAAVLLFAEEPGGLLKSKATIRILHYRGVNIENQSNPNLLKPPRSISGPLAHQIVDAHREVINELASGVQMGTLGFEVAQQYPTRVIKEAITNAVLHRDYGLSSDIQIRLFSDRIEVESPGALPGKVTTRNIRFIGSFCRNPLIVSNLRELPEPPNLDAGEGVRMMFQTMDAAGLYPPVYLTRATTGRDAVRVVLLNESRPTTWDQVADYLSKNGTIANAELRTILKSDDTLFASKMLRDWVDRGLLEIENPNAGKRARKYRLAESDPSDQLFSTDVGKE